MKSYQFCPSYFLSLIAISLLFSCRKESSLHQSSTRDSFFVETRASYNNTDFDHYSQYDISEDLVSRYVRERDKSAIIRSIDPFISKGVVTFYVVNLEKGWMIISSDARTKAVLAKGESGSFDLSARDNSNVQFWLQDMADQILAVKQSDIVEIDYSWKQLDLFKPRSRVPTDTLYRSSPVNADSVWIVMRHSSDTTEDILDIPHLLETHWGQFYPWDRLLSPFNSGMITYVTGSFPTAIAQILYYYHNMLGQPAGLYHSISILSMYPNYVLELDPENGLHYVEHGKHTSVSRSDYYNVSSRWEEMPLDYLESVSNMNGASYVSELMIDIGNRLDAVYDDFVTSVLNFSSTSYVDLSKCNIEYDWDLYSSSIRDSIFLNLSNSRPVIVTAQSANSDNAWVIDGCYHKKTTIRETYSYHHISYADFIDGIRPSSGVFVDWFISLQELNWFYPNAPLSYDQVTRIYHDRFFRMNWGASGNPDDGLYSCNPLESWNGYTENGAIYYNLLPSTSFEFEP